MLSQIINDLRFTTFWATYSIWTKRQSLNRTYWKIIPECCKFVKKKTTKTLEKKRKRRTKKAELDACQNPFHYLTLKKNVQPSQGTCGCTAWVGQIREDPNNIEKTQREQKDLDYFINQSEQKNLQKEFQRS